MRRISTYDASECAEGRTEICNCRCEGVLHGKSHRALIKFEDEMLAAGNELSQTKVSQFLKQKTKVTV